MSNNVRFSTGDAYEKTISNYSTISYFLAGCSNTEQVEEQQTISKEPVVRNTPEEVMQREETPEGKEVDVVEDSENMEESTTQKDDEEVSYEEANIEQDISLTPDKRIEMLGASKEYQEGDVLGDMRKDSWKKIWNTPACKKFWTIAPKVLLHG